MRDVCEDVFVIGGGSDQMGPRKVTHAKNRNEKIPPFTLEVTKDDTGLLRVTIRPRAGAEASGAAKAKDEAAVLKAAADIERVIRKEKPKEGFPGLTTNELADYSGHGKGSKVFLAARRGLEAQGSIESVRGPGGSVCWRLRSKC